MTPLISTPRRRLSAPPCEIVAIQTGAAKRAQCRGRAAVKVGSRMTAARVTRGAISLRSSSQDDVRRDPDQFRRVFTNVVGIAPQRVSIRTLRPSVQPNCCSPCRNAAMRACPSGSFAAVDISTPICRTRSGCCARAARPRGSRAAEQDDELPPFTRYLVGAREQRWRHIEAERLGRFQIDHQLVFGRRLHRQVAVDEDRRGAPFFTAG
jgi:hypothetical protein